MKHNNDEAAHADALVLFGITGDLARKKIFPAHYLAIPPALFETFFQGLDTAGLTAQARVIVEKLFGRDVASARQLNRILRSVFAEDTAVLAKNKVVYLPEVNNICPVPLTSVTHNGSNDENHISNTE